MIIVGQKKNNRDERSNIRMEINRQSIKKLLTLLQSKEHIPIHSDGTEVHGNKLDMQE